MNGWTEIAVNAVKPSMLRWPWATHQQASVADLDLWPHISVMLLETYCTQKLTPESRVLSVFLYVWLKCCYLSQDAEINPSKRFFSQAKLVWNAFRGNPASAPGATQLPSGSFSTTDSCTTQWTLSANKLLFSRCSHFSLNLDGKKV